MIPLDFTRLQLLDKFWAPRQETNRRTTLHIQYKNLRQLGSIAAIDPDYHTDRPGARHIYRDSDIAKWLEAASYTLATSPDSALESQIDEVIELYAKAQGPDGYLNTWFTVMEPHLRFTNLRDRHELYCAGHLMEAAVAHFRATGKRRFLDICCRYADYLDTVFGTGEGRMRGYPGHEEIELALVKLYEATGHKRYLKLASYFIDERGQKPHYFDIEAEKRGEDPRRWRRDYRYNQSHIPVREQTEVTGHAVRAMYLYCGMADVARHTGDRSLAEACRTLWHDLVRKHLFITGGIGQSKENEGFTFPYDLPEETAYCETCAAIGLVFWNHRLLHLFGEGQYADCLERGLYNGTISGMALSGDRFFYTNPLASLGHHHRQEWFTCACCPGNISRLVASVGQFFYSTGDDKIWVHLYAQSRASLPVGDEEVLIEQETDYPWDGTVIMRLSLARPHTFTLALRIPGWCRQHAIKISGTDIGGGETEMSPAVVYRSGYAELTREWHDGDLVELRLAMPVERVRANPAVRQANGKIVLQRGPIVYCLEETDNPYTPLTRIAIPRKAPLSAHFAPDLLGGVSVITGPAEVVVRDEARDEAAAVGSWDGLYTTDLPQTEQVTIKAVPYCVWDNREPGEMLVWLQEGI
ncbi:MAG TPA: glycoside hydrolase family 127 protein [Firmicutes bacterium]|nr:glycoside hydrolase family 127 protein [Bacillota bacterium]